MEILSNVTAMSLMREILGTEVASEELAIYWLGQNSFILKTSEGTIIGVDLYLSRVITTEPHVHAEPPIKPEDVVVDYAFSTHDHLDHLDPYTVPGVLKRSPKAVFIGTPEGREHFIKLGVPGSQAVGMKPRETLTLRDFKVTAYYSIDPREKFTNTTHYGFLYTFPACKVYNLGDSSPGMAEAPQNLLQPVAEAKPDIAMLPVIGDYPARTPAQAYTFAKIIRPRIAVPMHYGCFAPRNVDPVEFTKLFTDTPDIKPVIIPYRGKYTYARS